MVTAKVLDKRILFQAITTGVLFVPCLALFWLSAPKALADKFNTETSSSVRALGAGNAGINTDRGSYSAFYNPANIAAKNTGNVFQLVNFKLGVSDGFLAQAGKGQSMNVRSLSSLYDALSQAPNTFEAANFSVYPNITLRHFSLGLLYEVDQGAMVRASDRALIIKARNRFAPVAALSFRLFKGIFRIGFSSQYVTVGNASSVVQQPIQSSNLDFKQSINAGSGFVHTGGVTLSLPFRYLPSFSVVARNIGDTNFTGAPMIKFGEGSNLPSQPLTFDVGTSFSVYLGKRIELKSELDYRDTVNKLQGNRFRHVFFGSELILFDYVRFRGGMAHGYTSFGFGINTPKASIDMAVYSDELDDRIRGTEDRRYVLQYTHNLFGKAK